MRLSQFHLATVKETPADAEIVSHQLMLRAGMLRKLAAGIYTWTPLGLRILRKVEAVVREEMERSGAIEMLMPSIQPRELWEETGRWKKFGGQLLKLQDRKKQFFCYGPTHEEVITDFARNELKSYRQLPVNFFQIQTKFRDEIRPRFGVMRAREFLMKDAYSFHLDQECLAREYRNMFATYTRIFTRLGLRFRAVKADTGAIGGQASYEFHVLADSGEDAIVFASESDYAANIEMAQAKPSNALRESPTEPLYKQPTPTQKTCEAIAELLNLPLCKTVKSIALMSGSEFILALLRGDHTLNEIKLARRLNLTEYRMANEEDIDHYLGTTPGFIGPLSPHRPIRVVADLEVANMANFVVGANQTGFHYSGVNWGRDLPEPEQIADIRNVVAGDLAPDGGGYLSIIRGIEVGHIFQLGSQYAESMHAVVTDDQGHARTPLMGCYGIGISRIVAAAIEQNHDAAGIIWPTSMAPWSVAICPINTQHGTKVQDAAESLYQDLQNRNIEVVLDNRGLRPGPMFSDMELIGIPQRIVVSERGLKQGLYEYRARHRPDNEYLDYTTLLERIQT